MNKSERNRLAWVTRKENYTKNNSHIWNRIVEGQNECWIWTGTKSDKGYGKVSGKKAHRTVYEIEFGVIPDGLHVLHKCDNKSCVNPNHLYLGTESDNRIDQWARNEEYRKNKTEQLAYRERDILGRYT